MADGIALCFSGGGYRSALFHLGALRRLKELRLLHEVETVSSVSGGSILSAFFATKLGGACRTRDEFSEWLDRVDWEPEIAAPFRAITARDIRTVPILKHVLWNWVFPGPRVSDLEKRYKRHLTAKALGELPEFPRFVYCATDLTFGVNWTFERERAGDYLAGYVKEAESWPIARAVAASSCFPPIFGPVPVHASPESYRGGNYRASDRDRLLKRLILTDGGVYDNLGLEPAWKGHGSVLVSDCGAPFDFAVGKMPIRHLMRYTSVIMNQAAALRKRMHFDRRRAGSYTGTYWGIRSACEDDWPGYHERLVEDVIAEVRTDLDAFTEAEQKILENHGYFAANRSVLGYFEHDALESSKPEPPHPEWMDESEVRDALRTSHRRLSFKRWRQVRRDKKK